MVFDCGQISKTRDLPNTISTKILSSPDRGAILSNYLKYVKCKIRKTSELSSANKFRITCKKLASKVMQKR